MTCEPSRWRTAKLSNRQGENAQETPPTVKSSSWWLISADVRLAPLSEEKTLPQGECITVFVCCQSEIECPCVLKPAEAHYLPSAEPVSTVTLSALRLPVSNPLLQPALDWPVRPSSSVQTKCRNLRLFWSCPPVYSMHFHFMPTKHFTCNVVLVIMSFCLWLFLCGQSARTMSALERARRHASDRDAVVKCSWIMNDISLTLKYRPTTGVS